MDLKSFLKKTFGKDLFKIKDDDLLKERIKLEKKVEKISGDIEGVQENIQKLLLQSKGKPKTLKLLNVQKIKALRLQSNTKQQEASQYLKQLSIIFLVNAMKQQQKNKQKSKIVDSILSTDIEHLNSILIDQDVIKALEEGKIDEVKDRLEAIFGKEELLVDTESRELLKAIDDLESVDEETALEKAKVKSKEIAEKPQKELE